MARKRDYPEATPPSISLEEGKHRLEVMRDKGKRMLASRPLNESAVQTWANTTLDYLKQTFGSESGHLGTFCGTPQIRFSGASQAQIEQEEATQLAER
jgi:hypothetical protein